MARIVIVPTSHIAEESLGNVKRTIEREDPDLVAVELDMDRFIAMEEGKNTSIHTVKNIGFLDFSLYFLMKKLQDWLGKKVGILPGSEMLMAVRIAEERGIDVAFIDRDIRITFFRMGSIPWREKLKLVWFLVKGFLFGWIISKIRREGIDLRKVPPEEVIDRALSVIKREFPNIYRVLVRERDIFMSRKLIKLSGRYRKIVAVVGAGHKKGLEKLLHRTL